MSVNQSLGFHHAVWCLQVKENSKVWVGPKMTGTLWVEQGMNKGHIKDSGSVWLWISACGPGLSQQVKFYGSQAKETAGLGWIQKWLGVYGRITGCERLSIQHCYCLKVRPELLYPKWCLSVKRKQCRQACIFHPIHLFSGKNSHKNLPTWNPCIRSKTHIQAQNGAHSMLVENGKLSTRMNIRL